MFAFFRSIGERQRVIGDDEFCDSDASGSVRPGAVLPHGVHHGSYQRSTVGAGRSLAAGNGVGKRRRNALPGNTEVLDPGVGGFEGEQRRGALRAVQIWNRNRKSRRMFVSEGLDQG